ncbi:chromate transporter [Pectinatus frisingensis]|jgi:chromate transporter|uniref:chromate transporter n=1 Tax=Pectinatus frisingensis TaxID=865 RepID=UPI0015F4435E|nr:chromate transporter [Pectinatus frisingensis]
MKNINNFTFSMRKLFFIWCGIGVTSFGGGAVTQFLIQDKFIYKYRWLTEDEYTTIVGIGQITPGINILAYTILIGRKLAGWRGSIVSVLGLIIPSTAITLVLSAVYLSVSRYAFVQDALKSVFASIFGVSIVTNWRNIKPILCRGSKEGALPLLSFLLIIIGTVILYQCFAFSVIFLYFIGSMAGVVIYTLIIKKKPRLPK